jgi:hypothetical protein
VLRVLSKSDFLLGEERSGMQIFIPLVAARNIAAVKYMGVGYSYEFMQIGYSAVTRSIYVSSQEANIRTEGSPAQLQ